MAKPERALEHALDVGESLATVGGAPGIHFLSLDPARSLAVAAARLIYRLPYRRASAVV